MKPDGMLVESEYLQNARQEISDSGALQTLAAVSEAEPALASYIYETLAEVAGKLALSGAPTPIIQAAHEDALTVILTCIGAIRQGHYELWKDTMTADAGDRIDTTTKPKPRQGSKKSRKNRLDEQAS